MPLIPLADVQAAIFGAVTRLEPVEVDPRGALGLVLAEQVTAPEAVPPFPNTAMDGYAVRAADTAGAAEGAPVRLRVVGELAAGHAPTVAVGDGEAIRIMTGAPMPDGADAIVMVERTRRDGDDGVLVEAAVTEGLHVRLPG
ncbi:MAG TPA: molybdopterin molybdenumtransferase MoeA, partial [Acidimicrobiia bacterium]|nr:molybdopterin molybdenumtransferase MoeA [Acidimicrobiia bacterium]